MMWYDDFRWVADSNDVERIVDPDGTTYVEVVFERQFKQWFATLYNEDYGFYVSGVFDKVKSKEDMRYQVTRWANTQCRHVVDSFDFIRDHLPNTVELRNAMNNVTKEEGYTDYSGLESAT